MLQAENREKLLLYGAVLAVGILAGDKILLTPLLNAWDARAERVDTLRADIAKGNQLIDGEQRTRNIWRDYRVNGLSKDRSSAEAAVFDLVGKWGDEARLNISSLLPQWRDDEDDHTTLECRLQANGDMYAIAKFLYALDESKVALRAESIEISNRDKSGRQLNLDLKFTGLTINDPPPTAVSSL